MVEVYQCFRGTCCVHYQGDYGGGSKKLGVTCQMTVLFKYIKSYRGISFRTAGSFGIRVGYRKKRQRKESVLQFLTVKVKNL
jgi:hypothetical protein